MRILDLKEAKCVGVTRFHRLWRLVSCFEVGLEMPWHEYGDLDAQQFHEALVRRKTETTFSLPTNRSLMPKFAFSKAE